MTKQAAHRSTNPEARIAALEAALAECSEVIAFAAEGQHVDHRYLSDTTLGVLNSLPVPKEVATDA